MKTLALKSRFPKGSLFDKTDFYSRDFVEVPSSLIPGEWVRLHDAHAKADYLGHANPFAADGLVVRLANSFDPALGEEESLHAWAYIRRQLRRALAYRRTFKSLLDGHRLVFGGADGIPGLVVDVYENCLLAQSSAMGVERFREKIRAELQELCGKPVYFLDSTAARKKEGMPEVAPDKLPGEIRAVENGLRYVLGPSMIQKAGLYYDHRENRAHLERSLLSMDFPASKGLDLFCYAGGWGLHLLRAGVQNVDFVDQADVGTVIDHAVKANIPSPEGRHTFHRGDVFVFLDKAASQGVRYDVVVSDPPGMAKTEKDKGAALSGYLKIHQKVMKILSPSAIFAAASCTRPVSLEDLARTVEEAATAHGKLVRMLAVGGQGPDHPTQGPKDRSNYLKYILYHVQDAREAR